MGTTGLSALLRVVMGTLGALAFFGGLVLVLGGEAAGGAWILRIGVVLLLVALYEQTRYGGRAEQPAAAGSLPGGDE